MSWGWTLPWVQPAGAHVTLGGEGRVGTGTDSGWGRLSVPTTWTASGQTCCPCVIITSALFRSAWTVHDGMTLALKAF